MKEEKFIWKFKYKLSQTASQTGTIRHTSVAVRASIEIWNFQVLKNSEELRFYSLLGELLLSRTNKLGEFNRDVDRVSNKDIQTSEHHCLMFAADEKDIGGVCKHKLSTYIQIISRTNFAKTFKRAFRKSGYFKFVEYNSEIFEWLYMLHFRGCEPVYA